MIAFAGAVMSFTLLNGVSAAFGDRRGAANVITRETTCENEFVLHESKCFKQDFADPQAFCPPGTFLDGIDCVRQTELVASCPPDAMYSMETGSCIREVAASKIPVCADGFDLVERRGVAACQRVVVTQTEPFCNAGCIMEANSCWTDRAAPSFSCDDDDERLEGRQCVKEVVYDCDAADDQHRHLLSFTRGDYINHRVSSGGVANIMSGRSCRRTARRDALQSCNHGHRLIASRCVDPTPAPAQFRCAGVYGAEGESTCRHVDTMAPEWSCPEGFTEVCRGILGKQCRCVAHEEVAPMVECPSDFAELPNGACMQYFPAAVQCPEGYNLDGDRCVQTCFYAPIVPTCSQC